MSDGKLLIVSLAICLIVGVIVNLILTPFIVTTESETFLVIFFRDVVFGNINVFPDGFSLIGIDNVSINPFSYLPNDMKDFVLTTLVSWQYIPDIISFPLLLLIFVAILYALIKALPTT